MYHAINFFSYNINVNIYSSLKIKITKFKTNGKIIFQRKYINSSYRIRDNKPRILIIIKIIKLTPMLTIIKFSPILNI